MFHVHEGSDNNNLDLSLSVAPVSHHSYMADPGNYGSFGSGGGGGGGSAAEYASEVPPMTSHEAMPQPHTAPQQHPSHAQAMYQMGVVGGLHGPTGPQFPPQNLYIPPISQHGPIMAAQSPYRTTGYVGGGHGVAPTNPVYTNAGIGLPTHNLMMANAAAASAMIPSPYNYPRPPAATRTGGSPNSAGSPSPGSEDSDDSTHLQAGGRGKRPSPEACVEPQLAAPAAATPAPATKGKKARVSKKSKKKKDPNEPQKPVSAYALFFRDTQAAIKGQNPNASFGEVSKIVASMWDGLDADTKSVYKKKTDEKKKEYLKELAAYRASLVSKGEGDIFSGATGAPGSYQPPFGASQQYAFPASTSAGAMPPPQGHVSPQQLSPLAKKSPLMPGMPMPNDGGQSALMNPPMSQPMPPSAPSMMSHGPIGPQGPAPQNASRQPPARTSPHLNPMPPSPYNMTQNNAPLGSPVSAISGDPIHKPPQQPNPQQQQQSQHQHQHQQHHHQQPPQAPPPQHNMQPSPQQQHGSTGVSPSGPTAGGLQACGNGGGSCIRAGCTNPAVHNPEWEDEYCSNECVVSHCRDVFNSWVASGQSAAPSYPASVK